MNDDTIYFSKNQQNKRDLTKLTVLSVFTVVWLAITLVNNIYLSKKSQAATAWNNTVIEQNDKILKTQDQITEKLKFIQKSVDSLEKSMPLVSPKHRQ